MVQAQTAASRAKRRRLLFKKRQRESVLKNILKKVDLNADLCSSKNNKNGSSKNKISKNKISINITQKSKRKKSVSFQSKATAKKGDEENSKKFQRQMNECKQRNLNVVKDQAKKAKLNQKIIVDDQDIDALSLQYMYLPKDVKSNLLREVLRNRRKEWNNLQDKEQKLHSLKVETHRAINVEDVRKMLKGDLHASGLEKETIVRWKRKPFQLWTSVTPDLDWAIDIAITHCVWDC